MAGTLKFGPVPKLPDKWWEPVPANEKEIAAQNKANVWPSWGEFNNYFWGANSGNQFTARGALIGGGGMAGTNGPSRGRGHPQYVGYDTMSDPDDSKTANDKVISDMKSWMNAGHTVVIPTYPDRFSLGTGIAIGNPNATEVQAVLWGHILDLMGHATNQDILPKLWTPDMSLASAKRDGSRVDLPDLAAMKAYHAKLVAAS